MLLEPSKNDFAIDKFHKESMEPKITVIIRLYVINFLDPSYLRRLYSELEEVASEKITKIRLEAKEIKAA